VDEIYGKHKYDLILSFHLFLQLYDLVDYFSKMRTYLSKDGHLFIAVNKSFPTFSLADFTDFTGLLGKLSQEPLDSPVYKGLRQLTRELLKEKAIHEPDEPLKESIVADFNGMLLNPNFSIDFLDKEINGLKFKKKMSFSQDEIYFITWLLLRLKESVYGRNNFSLSFFLKDLDFTNRRLNKYDRVSIKYGLLDKTGQLNKLIIIQKFRPYLYQGKTWESPNPYTSINDKKFTLIKDLMEQAGYQLENKYDFIPFAALLDFKKGIGGIKPKKILNDQEL